MKVTITLQPPPPCLRPNARVRWQVKAPATRSYRRSACIAAKAALNGARPPGWLSANVLVTCVHSKPQRMDPDNLIGSLKAAFDGIADAGIIGNDRSLWPLRPRFERGEIDRIVLTIEEDKS